MALGKDYERQELKDDLNGQFRNANDSESDAPDDQDDDQEDSKQPINENANTSQQQSSTINRIIRTRLASKSNIFNELIFKLNSESQKETIFLKIPDIHNETYHLQRWKNR